MADVVEIADSETGSINSDGVYHDNYHPEHGSHLGNQQLHSDGVHERYAADPYPSAALNEAEHLPLHSDDTFVLPGLNTDHTAAGQDSYGFDRPGAGVDDSAYDDTHDTDNRSFFDSGQQGQRGPRRSPMATTPQYLPQSFSHKKLMIERRIGRNQALGFQARTMSTPYRMKHTVTHRTTTSMTAKKAIQKKSNPQHVVQQGSLSCMGSHLDCVKDQFDNMDVKLAESEADRQSTRDNLNEALIDKRAVEDRLHMAEQEKHGLSAENERQKAAYSGKFGRLRTFVDGLGSDHSSLKKEFTSHVQTYERLVQEMHTLKETREILEEQLQACNEKSVKLRNEAIAGFKDSQSSVIATKMRLTQLEKELNEKSDLLAEERDLRTRLQDQLNDAKSSREAISRAIKSDSETILDKLFEIHADMEQHEEDRDTTAQIEKIVSALNSMASNHVGGANDIKSLKELIQGLSQGFSNMSSQVSKEIQNELPVKSYLEEALKSIKSDIVQQEQLVNQNQSNLETIRRLEEKNERNSELATHLKAAQESETQLRDQIAVLQASVTSNDSDDRIRELADEMQTTQAALDATKAELAEKANELRQLTGAKTVVDAEVESLRQQMQDMENTNPADDVENIRTEMSRQAAEHSANQRATFDNERKKLATEREKLTARLKQRENELTACNNELNKYRSEYASTDSSKQRELEQLQVIADQRKSDIDNLQSSLDQLKSDYTDLEATRGRLSTQNNAQEQQLQEADRENTTLSQRIGALEREAESGRGREQKATEAVARLEGQLREAENGAKKLSASSTMTLQKEKKAGDQRVKDIQESLDEVTVQLKEKNEDHHKFCADVERSWQNEEEKHKQSLAEIRGQLAEAEAAKDEALANNERLRAEMAKKLFEDASQPRSQQAANRNASKDQQSAEAAVPASSIDAALGLVLEESQHFLGAQVKGPIVEESQDAYMDGSHPPNSSPLTVSKAFLLRRVEVPASQDDAGYDSEPRLTPTPMVPDSQSGPRRPATFAQFQARVSTLDRRQQLQLGIEIHEDSDEDVYSRTKQDSQDDASRVPLQERSSTIDYHFKKPMPPPNSSQKLVRSNSETERSKHFKTVPRPLQISPEYHTPEPHARPEDDAEPSSLSRRSQAQSSSPDFIQHATMKQTLTTYQGQLSATKQSMSQGVSADRDEARQTPSKRKADSENVAGYEAARKKRTGGVNKDVRGQSGLRSLSQSSEIAQLGLTASQPAPASRMRSSAGTSNRQTRGAKKLSKTDEANARFAQELDGY